MICKNMTALSTLDELNELRSTNRQDLPSVSVVMPVYNEEKYIGRILQAVLQQDYPLDRLEIIVADGKSTDHTADIVRALQSRHFNIRLIENPERIVPTGLNRAITCASGDVIVRLDGHCEYPNDYVRRVVELRQQLGADNVGGVLAPVGTSYVQRAVAAAYCSPVGFGGSALKAAAESASVREVDAVHGGCWKRTRLVEIGGFDEKMVRNQDDELSFRLRKSGGHVFQSADIRVQYHVRDSYRKLFKQFAQYGYWKVWVIRKHPRQASVRHLFPAALVATIVASTIGAVFSNMLGFAALSILGAYLGALMVSSILQVWKSEKSLWPGVVAALVAMHIGYGSGFMAGCLRLLLGPLVPEKVFLRPSR